MTRIPEIRNEWGQLQETYLGIAETLIHAREHAAPQRFFDRMFGLAMGGRPVSKKTTDKFRADLQGLRLALESREVAVRTPTVVVPEADEPLGLGQLFPRDILIVIGETVVRGRPRCPSRLKERRGMDDFLVTLKQAGIRVIEVPEEPDLFLEGGDLLIDLPHVYVGIGGHATSERARQWLEKQLAPEIKVIPVPLVSAKAGHLDTCLTLIGPKLSIFHKQSIAKLPSALRGHEFIEVDDRTKRELGTNVLAVNPTTIIIQERHVQLGNALKGRGFNIIPLPFTSLTNEDGGFRCATAPLRRG